MQEKKVVVIGGGVGTEVALSGLKGYTFDLTALVSTFDASSRGLWQHGENGSDYVDEVRSSLLALGADQPTTQIMERLFAYRPARLAEQHDYTFGNLFLSALMDITGAADLALKA